MRRSGSVVGRYLLAVSTLSLSLAWPIEGERSTKPVWINQSRYMMGSLTIGQIQDQTTPPTPLIESGQDEARELGERVLRFYQHYKPKSMLQRAQHLVQKPKFPVADIHCHWEPAVDPRALIKAMDSLGVTYAVNLSGGWGERLVQMLNRYKKFAPDRFEIFCSIDFSEIDQPNFREKWTQFLVSAKAQGASGLKIFKDLGLTLKDQSGKVVPIDDPRIDPIWTKCGELGMPVLIHSADPLAFFQPIDRFNERVMQLGRHPNWSFYGPGFPIAKRSLLKGTMSSRSIPRLCSLVPMLAAAPRILSI